MISPAPKPAPKEKKARKPLQSKTWLSDGPRKPLKKSGQTKAKKVARQKAFYSSAAWKQLRGIVLDVAGQQCEYRYIRRFVVGGVWITWDHGRCEATGGLQVHHKTNVRFGGDERPEDLQVLCKRHHELVEYRDHPTRKRR